MTPENSFKKTVFKTFRKRGSHIHIFPVFAFVGHFVLVPCTSMLSSSTRSHLHCITVPRAQHSTLQQSARTKPHSKYVPMRVRQRKRADREHPLVLYRSTASTAQNSATSPHKAAKASTCRPEYDNAGKQAELERASTYMHVVDHVHSYGTLNSLHERRNQICPAYKDMQLLILNAGVTVMHEGLAFTATTLYCCCTAVPVV